MKVILTQEIKGRGGEGDVIEVKRGYAVNFLFPKKLAIQATEGNLKQLEQRRHNIEKREVARMSDANTAVEYLTGKEVIVPMKVGEEGRLFGSVTAPMIADALAQYHGIDVDRRKIEVKAPIKELGTHQIDINVYRDLKAPIIVKVISDGEVIDTGLTAEEAGELVDAEQAAEAEAKTAGEEDVVDDAAEEAEKESLGTEIVFGDASPGQEEVLAEGAPVEEELVAEAAGADAEEWTQV
ncbi:MAG: 50S ribosomal protein L9 [Coriobacteriia bacterium]|nr:50S ribosomal protein L9 [Coriobacteriia bacterium]